MGHGGQKLDFMCILNHLFVVLINLFYRLNFLFRLMGKGLFYASDVLFFFVECYFLSIVSMELIKKLMCLVNQLRSDYFGNLSRVENALDYLFVIDQCQF